MNPHNPNEKPLKSPSKDSLPQTHEEPLVENETANANWCSGVLLKTHALLSQMIALRSWLFAIMYAVVFAIVYWLALLARFDFDYTELVKPKNYVYVSVFWRTLPYLIGVKICVFYLAGHFYGWWRFVTFADLVALLRSALLSSLVFAAGVYLFMPGQRVPGGVLCYDCCFTILVLGGMRASWRIFREHFSPFFDRDHYRAALLIGVDHDSALLAHQIHAHSQLRFRIKGFVSASSEIKPGTHLGRIPVLGEISDLPLLLDRTKASDVLVTAGLLPGSEMRRLMETCRDLRAHLKIIPPIEDLFGGDNRIPLRDIEINDLLRRDPVQLDAHSIRLMINDRKVMVTGAGGSIGSEICRQVLKYYPKQLILVGNGENPIFRIEQEIKRSYPNAKLELRIGSVADPARMRQVMDDVRPDVIFHAAAHKHVPLMEVNVGEAVRNNVFGTKNLVDLADEFGVGRFVFISTDKAVHPSSVMGTTKQIAERYVHAMSQESSSKFAVVRFGNVLGSDGSVVPTFKEQIRRGGPITVTDPRMTRFFMTIPEASQLVLQAAAMGNGGEIFVLEMGEPVRIVDLAKDLIRLSGLPEHAVEIMYTGMRSGEKLYEELYFADEETLPTNHPKLRAAYHRPYTLAEVREAIAQLEPLLYSPNAVVRQKLREIVLEYTPPTADAGSEKSILDGKDGRKPRSLQG